MEVEQLLPIEKIIRKLYSKFCYYISLFVTSISLQTNFISKIKNYQNPLLYGSKKESKKEGCS
jgi:hypothetical protein